MPVKRDQDATTGTKLLRLFQRLMLDGRRHYQGDLAEWLNCSRQTIIRLATEIERVIGASLETGMDQHRRWYRMVPRTGFRIGPELEEVRYLRVCRDMAAPYLPEQVAHRVDESILRLSLAMSDATATEKAALQKPRFAFFSKGRIDYTPFSGHIEALLEAQEGRRIPLLDKLYDLFGGLGDPQRQWGASASSARIAGTSPSSTSCRRPTYGDHVPGRERGFHHRRRGDGLPLPAPRRPARCGLPGLVFSGH